MIIFGLTDTQSKGADGDNSAQRRLLGFVLLVVAVICKVCASIWVDYALKKRGNLSIPIQSANISIATLLPSLAFVFILNHVDNKPVSALMDGWSIITGVFVVYILMKNWMSNTIIKRFSSTTKYIVYAAAMLVTFVLEISLGFRSFGFVTFLTLLIVGYGVFLYASSKSTIESIVTSTIETVLFPVEKEREGHVPVPTTTSDLDSQSKRIDTDIDIENTASDTEYTITDGIQMNSVTQREVTKNKNTGKKIFD